MKNKIIGKYSLGIGDRFAHQAGAQLKGIQLALEDGIEITPVWNKSFREHRTIGSESITTRLAADAAVKNLDWQGSYFLDADHINLSNVEFFLDTCDFYTIDVADYIGQRTDESLIDAFVAQNSVWVKNLELAEIINGQSFDMDVIRTIAENYLYAIQEAGKIYRHIKLYGNSKDPVIEVSMDETENTQTPAEIFLILAGIAEEGIPIQTLAPKFTGRFNKGVEYVGDLDRFEQEFESDLRILKFAAAEFNLSGNLKLSIHSGSDKFSLYPIIGNLIRKFDSGIHVKTAGTTWLEEVIGMAAAGGEGLGLAKKIYADSVSRYDELCAPYSTVLDIDPSCLPEINQVMTWSSRKFVDSLRHDQTNPDYNLHFRQLIHVGYKIAAEMGKQYTDALDRFKKIIGENVTTNIYDRHIRRIFQSISNPTFDVKI